MTGARVADGAIVGLLRFVGCWVAFTIGLMAAANELPATLNKVCPTGNRPLRTVGAAAARVGPRVDIIEPHGGDELDAAEDFLPAPARPAVAETLVATDATAAPMLVASARQTAAISTVVSRLDSAPATAAVASSHRDLAHRKLADRGLPYRAAPIVAGADDYRPNQQLDLDSTHAPPGARTFATQPAAYFPPHYNRPPPSVSC